MKTSIAIATYNGEKYIKEQLQSMLDQTVMPDEIVISDDHSTDNTIAVINEFIEDNKSSGVTFKVLTNDKNNSGVTRNFENAMRNSTGDLIFISDQDDIWFKNKIERTIETYNRTGKSLIFHDAIIYKQTDTGFEPKDFTCYDQGFSVSKGKFDENNEYIIKRDEYLTFVANTCFINGMCMCVKRESVEKWYPLTLGLYHDYWIIFAAIANDDCVGISDCLAYYRIHNTNTCGFGNFNNKKSLKSKIKKFDKDSYKSLKDCYVWSTDKMNYLKELEIDNDTVKANYNFYAVDRINAAKKGKFKAILNMFKLYRDNRYANDGKSMLYHDVAFALLHTKKTRVNFINTFDEYLRK